MPSKAQASYLKNYAEQEVQLLESFPDNDYQHALVIPCYQESHQFIGQYNSDFATIRLLVIVIVNQPTSKPDATLQNAFCEHIMQFQMLWHNAHLSLHQLGESCDVLLVRRFDGDLSIPDKFGVGLARKIGADIAVNLIHNHKVLSPWIAFTDADARLPKNFFDSVASQDTDLDVLTFDYKHQGESGDVQTATEQYETGLKYFQAGLAWAGSRYAFHAVGSSLAVNSGAYAAHRGMPKRPAGEDFYLLNKIAKRGCIRHLPDCQIIIQSRISERTPFGTGAAVNKMLASNSLEYDYYHPECFANLRLLLVRLTQLPAQASYSVWLATLAEEHQPVLDKIGLEKYHAHHQKQCFSEQQLQRDIHCWFDGLKTLQFIHYLRDNHIANIPLEQALVLAPFKL